MKSILRLTLLCCVLSMIKMSVHKKNTLKIPKNKKKKAEIHLKTSDFQQKNTNRLKKMTMTKDQKAIQLSQQVVQNAKFVGFDRATAITAAKTLCKDVLENQPLYLLFKKLYSDSTLFQEGIDNLEDKFALIQKEGWLLEKLEQAAEVYSDLQNGVDFMNNLDKNVKTISGYGGISTFLKKMGPYGTILTMGFQIVEFCFMVKSRNIGLKQGLIEVLTTPSKTGKVLNAISNLSEKVDSLGERMQDMFDKLDQKNEFNIAKQNAFASVETVLFGIKIFQDQQQTCQEVNQKNSIVGDSTFSSDRVKCELAQQNFIKLLSQINYDYHYNEILKIYSGETNLLGQDFFSKLAEVNNQDQNILKSHYEYFQSLIKTSTLCLHAYKALQAFSTLQQMKATKIINSQTKTSDDQKLAEILDLIVLTSTCQNCQKLDYEYLAKVSTGDAIYCKRVPSSCKVQDEDNLSNEQIAIQKKATEMSQVKGYNWDKQMKTLFDNWVQIIPKSDQSTENLRNQIAEFQNPVSKTYSDNYLYQVEQLNFENQPNKDAYIFKTKNVLESLQIKEKDSKCNQLLEKDEKSFIARYQIVHFNDKSKQGFSKRQQIIDSAVDTFLKKLDEEQQTILVSWNYDQCNDEVFKTMEPILAKLDNYQFSCYSNRFDEPTFSRAQTYLMGEDRQPLVERVYSPKTKYMIGTTKNTYRFKALIQTMNKNKSITIYILHC